MNDDRNQVISIRELDIRSLAVMGLAFGLVASLVSLGILAYVLAGASTTPNWVELNAGLLSLKLNHPVPAGLLYAWPVISALGNALLFALVAALYNAMARLLGPVRCRISH
ncbi:MAG: hypothetical protein LC637_05845 [Xanthomonadaceae bacterium]|nr:hypothetical protein [Xanthomonadaceae bacterium]